MIGPISIRATLYKALGLHTSIHTQVSTIVRFYARICQARPSHGAIGGGRRLGDFYGEMAKGRVRRGDRKSVV